RITLNIQNTTKERIKCAHIVCKDIDTLDVGNIIEPGEKKTFYASTNDRVFCDFRGMESGTEYRLAMTCPHSSHNSACGYGSSGLQHYTRTDLAVFTFNIGTKDLADWNHGDEYEGDEIDYGDCS
ncbi:hypothetical protein BMR04_14310, partial [Methylococcaceae bacterium HT3]